MFQGFLAEGKSIHGKSRSTMCWSFDFGFWILDFWVSGAIKKATVLPQPLTALLSEKKMFIKAYAWKLLGQSVL